MKPAAAPNAAWPQPATLDHDGIARRIPHQGRMCLLDRLEQWSEQRVHCSAVSHRAPDNPLRTGVGTSAAGLLAPCAIEYAAQAMALHGALLLLAAPDVSAASTAPAAGYIASVRDVRLHVLRLDTIDGALQVHAERLAGDAGLVSYRFHVDDRSGRRLVDGRATVVLKRPPSGTAAAAR